MGTKTISAGVTSLVFNGVALDVGEECKFSTVTEEREAVLSANAGVIGFTTKAVAPYCEAEIIFSTTVSLRALQAAGQGPLQIQDGSLTYTIADAAIVGQPEMDKIKGRATVRWEGRDADDGV